MVLVVSCEDNENETCGLEEVLTTWQLPSLYRQLPGEAAQRPLGGRLGRGLCPGRPTEPHCFGMIPPDPKTSSFFL